MPAAHEETMTSPEVPEREPVSAARWGSAQRARPDLGDGVGLTLGEGL